MKNKALTSHLLSKIEENNFASSILNYAYFQYLPENLILSILNLDSASFNDYIIFIFRLNQKNLLVGNERKIISITEMFIFKMKSKSTKLLTKLLTETDIIDNKDILSFSASLLQVKNPNYLNAIKKVIYILLKRDGKNASIVDIQGYLMLIRRTKNAEQLSVLLKLILDKRIRDDNRFVYFAELILLNSQVQNLDFIVRVLKNSTLRRIPDAVEIIDKYLLTALKEDNLEKVDFICQIITNPNLLESSTLTSILEFVLNNSQKEDYPYLKALIKLRPQLDSNVFNILFKSVIKAKIDFQKRYIVNLIEHPFYLSNNINLNYVLDLYTSISSEFKLNFISKLLDIISISENTDLFNPKNTLIINAIKDSEYDFQAATLLKLKRFIDDSKYPAELVKSILSAGDIKTCYYIIMLFKIDNMLNHKELYNILDEILQSKGEYQMDIITQMLAVCKIRNSINCLKFVKCINCASQKQGVAIFKILTNLENLEDENNISLLENILHEENSQKLTLLMQIISIYEELGLEKTLTMIEAIKSASRKDLKEVIIKIKEEILNSVLNADVFEEEPKKKTLKTIYQKVRRK